MTILFKHPYRSIAGCLAAVSCIACASSPDFTRSLGVMPLRPPPPVWLGSVRGSGSAYINGAAALTPAQAPGWAHVLISLADVSTGGVYSWTLHSGNCGAPGSTIGPVDRFGEFVIRPDGTGAADALIPLNLSTSQTYAVVATPLSPATAPSACADLVYATL